MLSRSCLRQLNVRGHTLNTGFIRFYSKPKGSDLLETLYNSILEVPTSKQRRRPNGDQSSFNQLRGDTPRNNRNPNSNPLRKQQPQSQFQNANQNGRKPGKGLHNHKSKAFSPDLSTRSFNPLDLLSATRFNPTSFKWTQGSSTLENEYLTVKIKEVYAINPDFRIMFYSETGVKESHLKQFINSLEETESFDIVNIQTVDNKKFPFLRKSNKEASLKNYNEKLAEEKSKLYGRSREKKRDSGVKYVKVSWEISLSDLQNQKTNEIISIVKKNQKVIIVVDSKDKLSRSIENDDLTVTKGTDILGDLEKLKREKVFNHLQSLKLGSVEINGDIYGRCVVTIAPTSKGLQTPEEKKRKQNEKKLERQLKQQQREEEKKAKIAEKVKQFEQSLQA